MLKAAALYLGDLGPLLRTVMLEDGCWASREIEFGNEREALDAWGELCLEGFLTADEGYFWISHHPDAASVTVDNGAGHLFLTLDHKHGKDSSIGFVANAKWVLENGVGFLDKVVNTPRLSQETLERDGNIATLQ
jgi:hypothetical protein